MATMNFFVSGKKRKLVPVYVRVSAGRGIDLIVKSGLTVDPHTWSNTTQTIKQRIRTDDDEKLIKKLKELRDNVESEIRNNHIDYSKEWLQTVIDKFHNKKAADAKTLNEYIAQYIKDAESGDRKNKSAMNVALGTRRDWEGFKLVFDDFQGISAEERIAWRKKNKKPVRQPKKLDFNSINIDVYHSFVNFLTAEGYGRGTIGRFIKDLKFFMKKSLEDKLHGNREFQYSAFRGFTTESFSIYLTKSEIDKIYNIDLSGHPELDKSRDAFLTLCETGLRISDYQKVDLSIRQDETGTKLIYITQTKTGGQVVIPLSARLETILKKYNGDLPKTHNQYINRDIKIIAKMAGFDEVLTWETEKYGKKFQTKAHKYELISCHTGRRSACTNMFLAGIPPIQIMQISGHKSEKMFMRYIKVTPEQNARLLSSHPYFMGNTLKIAN
jgi:integrase